MNLLKLIPEEGIECQGHYNCKHRSIYPGYLDPDFRKYVSHLYDYLTYCSNNKSCSCYWPEYSHEAAQISDLAFLLFRDLILTTALSNVVWYDKSTWGYQQEYQGTEMTEFFPDEIYCEEVMAIALISNQLRFSDYYHVCKDIEEFSKMKFDLIECAKIRDKVLDILEILYPKFLSLYNECLVKHFSEEISQELLFIKFLINKHSDFEEDNPILSHRESSSQIIKNLSTINLPIHSIFKSVNKDGFFNKSSKDVIYPFRTQFTLASSFSLQSEIKLEQGTCLNEMLLFNEAIEVLSQAIHLNPTNKNAYVERAFAYFETNQLSLALQDYKAIKKLSEVPPYKIDCYTISGMEAVPIPENKKEFSKGLISGTVEGAKISMVEFIPSLFSSCRGILNGLWAFVCTPIEVSQELINTAFAVGEFISAHSTEECLQCVVPELKELSIAWDKLDDNSRGQKIGYIIGKYGVDIFIPIGTLKGVHNVRALKRANTMYTLESCAASEAKKAKILEESIKRASLREALISESVKKEKLLIKSSNVKYHVIQKKHAWDKVIDLSGDIENDFKKIITYLEDNNIINQKYLRNTIELPRDTSIKKILLSEYRATVEGREIQVFIEKYVDTGEVYLKNAWVVTK